MTDSRRTRRVSLFTALTVLSVVWLAAPHASQETANDGFILFTTDRDNPSVLGMCPNCEDIYVMSPDGSNPTRLTHGGADAVVGGPPYNNGGADWSHSKKLIAFNSNRVNEVPQIFLMNADGSEQVQLVSLIGGAAFPSFSHNGNELCFQSQTLPRRDIYIVDVHGEGLTNLTSAGQMPGQLGASGDSFRCDWSPKSNAVAFTSNRHDPVGTLPANRNDEIYVINADGSDLVRLTGGEGRDPAPGSDANAAWSPKGDRIAFESNRTGRPEIWVMNADGSDQKQLTTFDDPTVNPTNIVVTKPTWSPTGDRIAFHRRVGVAGQRGHFEVYTINIDATGVERITVSPTPGFSGFPSWGKWSAVR